MDKVHFVIVYTSSWKRKSIESRPIFFGQRTPRSRKTSRKEKETKLRAYFLQPQNSQSIKKRKEKKASNRGAYFLQPKNNSQNIKKRKGNKAQGLFSSATELAKQQEKKEKKA